MSNPARTEIVIAAVDKATATLNQISAKLESVTKPAGDLAKAFSNLYKATGLSAVKSAVGGLTSSLTGLATATVGVAGVYSGTIGSIIGFSNSAVEAADKIGDLASRYQVHAHTLQVYGALVEESGGSLEDAAASIGKLRKAMNEATHGGKEQAAAFAGVGISIAELKAMKPEDAMLRIADAFKGSTQEGAMNSVLLELMGKNGTVMMDTMKQGADAIMQKFAEMRADGRLLTDEQIKQADASDKAWRRMTGTIAGVKNSLGLQLAEKLQPLIEGVQKWVVANRALIQSKFDKFLEKLPGIISVGTEMFSGLWSVAQGVASAFKSVSSVLGPTITALIMIGGIMSPVIMAAGQLVFVVGKFALLIGNLTGVIPFAIRALSGLWSVMLANPIGIIIAAVAGMAYIIYSNWDGIVAYVSGAWDRIKAVFDGGFFDGLIQVWMESWQALGNGILGIIKSIVPDSWMPKALQDMQFTFATDRAQRVTAEKAAQAQRQDISNRISIKIDADGRPRVTEMKSGSAQTQLDVSTGLSMAGA